MGIDSLIRSISKDHQIVFVALTCEKLLCSIIKFDEQEVSKSIGLFEESITALYGFSLGLSNDLEEYQRLLTAVELLWPDLDETRNNFASYAFDAFAAMTEALNIVLYDDVLHVINCATAATDTVDMYVQMTSDSEPPAAELDAFIQASSFMMREVERQTIILEKLATMPVIDTKGIAFLRELNGQIDIIDLSALA